MDEEGLICDECGSRIGPAGCCATARKLQSEASEERADAIAYLRSQADYFEHHPAQLLCDHQVATELRLIADAFAQGLHRRKKS